MTTTDIIPRIGFDINHYNHQTTMRKAEHADKGKVISILTESFFDNKSVNYIVQNDAKIKDRIRYLMEYSFEQCLLSGEVYISDDGNGCASVQYFDRKKNSLDSIVLDVKLILKSVGIRNVAKVLKRESTIKINYPHMGLKTPRFLFGGIALYWKASAGRSCGCRDQSF